MPEGYFGHYVSSARHFLTPPGIHALGSTTERWLPDVLIDDEEHPNRQMGDKTVLQVPENHIAGGFRIGQHGEDSQDQEFCLFSQGRHVLPDSKFYGINVVKLDSTIVALPPLTVLYVKEGWLGGAFRKKEATYEILYPGPPYLLHEKDYEDIQVVKRDKDLFSLGPYTFVTVKDGSLGGAFRKSDGKWQALPPGHSYRLHSKDYERVELVTRKTQFKLGPLYYITVRSGNVAGAYRRNSAQFYLLPPGKTYTLNEDEWKEPIMMARNKHIISCGPLTLLTVAPGTLNGAYRVVDGAFVEFDEENKEYILHEKEYHSLVTIVKYSAELQYFGPFKVITIREGTAGVFEREGKIEIQGAGWYKVPSSVAVYDPIPTKVHQEVISDKVFKSKDGIEMAVKFTLTWHVNEPEAVARFAGTFNDLRALILQRAHDTMIRLCKGYNRGDLLPTQQDVQTSVIVGGDEAEEAADSNKLQNMASEMSKRLYAELEKTCVAVLTNISETSRLGVEMRSVQIDGFQLRDSSIMADLAEITKSQLATKAEKVKGELAIARANADKLAREKQAEANAQVRIKEAEADAAVSRTQAQADAEARISAARAENEAKVHMATADARAKAESDRIRLEVETAKTVQSAEAQARATAALAEAEFQKKTKENEANSHIPQQELDLKMMQLQVEMMREVGQAAWQYPEIYTGFLKSFSDKLRFGPMTAGEALRRAAGQIDSSEETAADEAKFAKKK